jgi:hypothetical protein
MVSEGDFFDEWAKQWDADNYRNIRAYNRKFISYILRKANNDSKVNLAIETLVVVNLYQAMALAVSPKCPEEYQAQVDALKGTLDKVFDYLHSDRYNKETESQLENEVIAVRQQGFLEFLGRCAGFEVKFEELGPDKVRKSDLDKVFRTPRGKYYQLKVIKEVPPPSQVPPSPKAIELAHRFAKALEEYHSQLVEYIMQKTDMDLLVPLALMGLEISYLNNNMASLFLFIDSSPCQDNFTGDSLLKTVEDIETIFGNFDFAYNSRKVNENIEDYEVDAMINSEEGAKTFIEWMADFILGMAECYGIDFDVVPVPKGTTVELKVMKYEPQKQDSQE